MDMTKEDLNKYKLASIEKVVSEFIIYGIEKIPFKDIRIKIYQRENKKMVGFTNLQCKDTYQDFYCGVGYGESEDETLINTIENFINLIGERNMTQEDFVYMDQYDF